MGFTTPNHIHILETYTLTVGEVTLDKDFCLMAYIIYILNPLPTDLWLTMALRRLDNNSLMRKGWWTSVRTSLSLCYDSYVRLYLVTLCVDEVIRHSQSDEEGVVDFGQDFLLVVDVLLLLEPDHVRDLHSL